MKKIGLFIILLNFFIVSKVFAETHDCIPTLGQEITVSLCQSGCDYDNVTDLVDDTETQEICKYNEVTINIMDNEIYGFSNINPDERYNIVGNNNDEDRPTVILGDNTYYINSMKNVKVGTQQNTKVIGLELDNVLVTGELYISGIGEVKIINSKFTDNFMISNENGNVIIDNVYVEKFTNLRGKIYINNSEFLDEVDIYGTGEIKNSKITSKSLYGLYIRRDNISYCLAPEGVKEKESFLVDNVNISGATLLGIYYEISHEMYEKFEIKNSDLVNNTCSFGASVSSLSCAVPIAPPSVSDSVFNSNEKKYSVKNLEANDNDYNVVIDNTKLVCACSRGLEGSDIKPYVFVSGSSTWVSDINRTTSEDSIIDKSASVLEMLGGKVLIEFLNSDVIEIDNSSYKNINSYFNDLKDLSTDEVIWRVANEEILKIENGRVIPLKAGETDIYGSYNNNEYTMHIKVTGTDITNLNNIAKHVVNPNTKDQIIVIIMLGITSGLYYLLTKFFKRKKINSY